MRKLHTNQRWKCEPIPAPPALTSFETWMAGQTGYAFALAHADDGVIWGRFDQGQWAWSSGIAPASPKLHAITLQQLRLFGANGELFLWRSGAGFVGRTIEDNVGESIDWFDEEHLLWGKADGQTTIAFQLMREGAQGLLHAPPTEIAAKGKLITRNYIDYDADGDYDADSCAYVKASRLVVKE